jgi:hypothetical protein
MNEVGVFVPIGEYRKIMRLAEIGAKKMEDQQ